MASENNNLIIRISCFEEGSEIKSQKAFVYPKNFAEICEHNKRISYTKNPHILQEACDRINVYLAMHNKAYRIRPDFKTGEAVRYDIPDYTGRDFEPDEPQAMPDKSLAEPSL